MSSATSKRQQRETKRPEFPDWAVGPMLLGVYSLTPVFVIFGISSSNIESFPLIMGATASVLRPILDAFYPATGVIVTVLLTFAAATGLGSRTKQFPRRARGLMGAATIVGAMLITLMAAATVTIALARPGEWPTVIGIIGVAWVAVLGAQMVLGIASPKRRAREANRVWRTKRDRAAAVGVDRVDGVPGWKRRLSSNAVLWLGAPLLWIVAAVLESSRIGSNAQEWALTVAFCVAGAFGILVSTIGWRSVADLSLSRRVAGAIRWAVVSTGASISVVLGLSLMQMDGYAMLGGLLILLSAAHAATLLVRVRGRGLGVFSAIEDAVTARSLRMARDFRDETRRLAHG